MTTTPKTGAPELAESQADKEETANEAFRRIEAGAGLFRIEDNDATAPPGVCADGDQYIPAGVATGLWAGHEGDVAVAVGVNAANGWYFIAPEEGMRAWLKDESAELAYDGAAWVAYVAGAAGASIIVASEALAARDAVNIWSDAGVAKVRKADPDDADKECDGFVPSAVAMGDPAGVLTSGKLGGFAGLTQGAPYYLAAAAGTVSDTAAGSALRQRIGKSISGTEILIRLEPAQLI